MKLLNKSLLMLSVILSAVPAWASSGQMLKAELPRMKLDPQLRIERPEGATVNLDPAKETATLTIRRGYYCPPGRICAMVMPEPYVVELPIVETRQDACGTVTTVARVDARPADGTLAELAVIDRSQSFCEDSMYDHLLEVRFDTATAGFRAPVKKTHSVLFGDEPLSAER